MLNTNFFTPNYSYTKEIAEKRLIDLGFVNFSYKGSSFSNGASFYFASAEGKEIRVSDHNLTGKRADECIQIRIVALKEFPLKSKK